MTLTKRTSAAPDRVSPQNRDDSRARIDIYLCPGAAPLVRSELSLIPREFARLTAARKYHGLAPCWWQLGGRMPYNDAN